MVPIGRDVKDLIHITCNNDLEDTNKDMIFGNIGINQKILNRGR